MHFEAFSIFCSLSKGLILARIQADACWGTPDWLGRALARHPVHLWRDHVWWSHHRSVGSPCVQHLFVDLGYAWAVIQHELGTWLQVTRCIQNGVQLIPEAAWFETDSDLHRSCFAQERKGETWSFSGATFWMHQNFMFCADIEPFLMFSESPKAFGVSLKNVCMFVVGGVCAILCPGSLRNGSHQRCHSSLDSIPMQRSAFWPAKGSTFSRPSRDLGRVFEECDGWRCKVEQNDIEWPNWTFQSKVNTQELMMSD